MNWRAVKHTATATTTRLAVTYVAIIMLMSIGFSIVFYNTSSHQLGRQVPPKSFFGSAAIQDDSIDPHTFDAARHDIIDSFLQDRIQEGRHELLVRLIWLNALALTGGAAISYYLARRTLTPIEAAMEAQSQFVSDASHELRTPLTALQTTNEVALRKRSLSAQDTHQLIEYNVTEAVKLKALSDALLSLLKNESGVSQPQPVSLQDAAGEAMNAIVRLALDKHIAVQDDVPAIRVAADKLALTQIVTILLDNAVKYSSDNTTIYLSGSQKARYGYLQVRDQGIGIKASDLPHIFRRFYRADKSRTSQQANGYGLGLAIAHKIIRQYHGDIHVESTPGQGSTFTIKLPLA